MKVVIFSCILFFLNTKIYFQIVENIQIYDFSKTKGYTYADAYVTFRDLEKQKTPKILVKTEDVIKIQEILKIAKTKKLHQMKFGTGPIFSLFFMNDKFHNFIIYKSMLLDQTANIMYIIKDNNDLMWLNDFVVNLKKGNLNSNK